MAFLHRGGWQPPIGSNILKAIGGTGRFGALAVRFSGPDEKDLQGEYFTPQTDFGPRNGDGSPVLIHHGNPLEDAEGGRVETTAAPGALTTLWHTCITTNGPRQATRRLNRSRRSTMKCSSVLRRRSSERPGFMKDIASRRAAIKNFFWGNTRQ